MTCFGPSSWRRSRLLPSEQGFDWCQGLGRPHLWFSLDLQDLHDLLRSEQLVQVQAPTF